MSITAPSWLAAGWRRLLRVFGPSSDASAGVVRRERCPWCGHVAAGPCPKRHEDESTVEENGWPLPW